MRKTIAALVTTGTIAALAAPVAAYASTTHTPKCGAVVRDHITKADNGHGTPAEWADLRLSRVTTIRCTGPNTYKVTLIDNGTLKTRPGAGTPNGTGGQISHGVPGTVTGIYHLTVNGQLAVPDHRDTTKGSTDYVTSLFAQGAQVDGGGYAWAYKTRCGEHWIDSSENNDGVGPAAGNITGKTCRPHHPTPTPTTGTPTPTPSGTTPTTPGEAPVPTPVNTDLPVTG